MTRVVNVKNERCDEYIGRSKRNPLYHFGNPFTHLSLERTAAEVVVESREESVRCYGAWLRGTEYHNLLPERREWILRNLHKLKNKRLGCFCKPLSCHGDILLELLNESTTKR